MSYYKPCKYCGANLDPDEECDCRQEDPMEVNTLNTKKMEDFIYGNINQDTTDRKLNCSN